MSNTNFPRFKRYSSKPVLNIPARVMHSIEGNNASDIRFIMAKRLEASDMGRQNRLYYVKTNNWDKILTANELNTVRQVDGVGLNILAVDERGVNYDMKLRKWNNNEEKFVLRGDWRKFIADHALSENDILEIWAFRVESVLNMALVFKKVVVVPRPRAAEIRVAPVQGDDAGNNEAAAVGKNDKDRMAGLVERLLQKIIGQDNAVMAVAEALSRGRRSFLFLGPMGVGKTALVNALAGELCDDETQVLMINMSDYMEQHSVAGLIGALSGYVEGPGGQLTEAVRESQYRVVLFDQVNKAHTCFVSTLLQILDKGSLSYGQDHTVDFKNTIVVMTSNLGAEYLLPDLTDKTEQQELVMQEVRKGLEPELLNLLDDVVMFEPLSYENLRKVTRLLMNNVGSRLLEKEICLGVTESALDLILAESYDPIYGARPVGWLERKVEKELLKTLEKEKISEKSAVYIYATMDGKALAYQVKENGTQSEAAQSLKKRTSTFEEIDM